MQWPDRPTGPARTSPSSPSASIRKRLPEAHAKSVADLEQRASGPTSRRAARRDRGRRRGRGRHRRARLSLRLGREHRPVCPCRGVAVLTPDGRLARWLYGLAPQPSDLALALTEAGQGRIGGARRAAAAALLPLRPGERTLQRRRSGRPCASAAGSHPSSLADHRVCTAPRAAVRTESRDEFLHAAVARQASKHAANVDALIAAFTVLIVLLAGPVFVLVFVFAVRYRRGEDVDRAHAPNRNVWIEVSWSAIPFFAVLGFYVWATNLYFDLDQSAGGHPRYRRRRASSGCGRRSTRTGSARSTSCTCRSGEPVRLVMTSQDVIHSFFVPALPHQAGRPARPLHHDLVHGRPGRASIGCSAPSTAAPTTPRMGGRVVVDDAGTTTRGGSARSDADPTLAAEGEILFRQLRLQRLPRRRLDRAARRRWTGVYGRPVPLAERRGRSRRRRAVHPRQHPVPAEAGRGRLQADHADLPQDVLERRRPARLVAYIKSLEPVAWRRE